MQIGKYVVDAHAIGSVEDGFQGAANRRWEEGSETREQLHTFDQVFPTMDEAIRHAYEQAHLRVSDGAW